MSATDAAPIRLGVNQPANRFYRGGRQIAEFRRGTQADNERVPEDWVASTTGVRGQEPVGLTTLPDGTLLRDAVADQPEWWLGSLHVKSFGCDTKLLVKLLDAGERLPVHAHPSVEFARKHLGTIHGKAEAWYILSPGVVHLGLARAVGVEELHDLVTRHQGVRLLDWMHRLEVRAGDRIFVPPGVLHSIGAGIFLAEVQEPEDLSILAEWAGFDIDGSAQGHLGLGFDKALGAVDRRRLSESDVSALVNRAEALPNAGLPSPADEYFRLHHIVVEGSTTVEAGFAVVLALTEDVNLAGEWGECRMRAGETYVVPAAAGALRLTGHGSILVARPPEPRL